MRSVLRFGVIVCCAIAAQAASTAFASDVTWLRESMVRRERAMMARILGHQAARRIDSPEIVGGNVAAPRRWPFQAALLDATIIDRFLAQYCGGILIHASIVLTAAHCVDGLDPADFDVLTGTQALETGGVRRKVTAIRMHPRYDEETADYDIALVKLSTPANNIALAKMIEPSQEATRAKYGTPAFVVGWGNLHSVGSEYPNRLHEVSVPLVTRSVCNTLGSYDGYVTLRMMCAGLPMGGKDSCQGDSGGPLLVRDQAGKFTIVAGITSWGIGCALPNFYGVYTRVAVLGAWARANMTAMLAAPPPVADCGRFTGNAAGRCVDNAMRAISAEMNAYLAIVRSDGNPAQAHAAKTAQAAWSASLTGICAFDATTRGELGRKECLLREMKARAGTLAAQAAAISE